MKTAFRKLVEELSVLLAHSPFFRETPPSVHAVVNPTAGLFARTSRLQRSVELLRERMSSMPAGGRLEPASVSVEFTEYPGHARQLAVEGIERLRGSAAPLLLSAGGDGTHRDLLEAVVASTDNAREPRTHMPVFRLPAGTGNDSADARTMNQAYRRLTQLHEPRLEAAIETRTADGRAFYAFNVASFGLDAVVSGVTNVLKRTHLPGNLYTLVADVATVLYVPIFGIPHSHVAWSTGDGFEEVEGRFAVVAFGVDGGRRYGRGKPILPDARNMCAIRLPPLVRRIGIKKHVYRGTHMGEPEVIGRCTTMLQIEATERMPFQFDGEMVWLTPEAFPVTMRIRPSAWASLQPRSQSKS